MLKQHTVLKLLPLLLSLSAHAQESDWLDAKINLDLVHHFMNERTCEQTALNFTACVSAVNYMGSAVGDRVSTDFDKWSKGILTGVSDPDASKDELDLKTWESFYRKNPTESANHILSMTSVIATRISVQKGDTVAANVLANTINVYLEIAKDPHTYIRPTAAHVRSQQSSSTLKKGIGITMRPLKDGTVLVVDVVPGGPADKGGVKIEDEILAINGVAPGETPIFELLSKAIAASNETTPVTFKVKRLKDEKLADVELKLNPGEVSAEQVSARIFTGESLKVGVITFKSFMNPAGCIAVADLGNQIKARGADTLIFDLRGNGGGLRDQAQCLMGVLSDPAKAPITGYERSHKNGTLTGIWKTDASEAKDYQNLSGLTLIVLVNASSASASEVLAGALKDTNRAIIIGERTFGKGTQQIVRQLPQNRNILLAETDAVYFNPGGSSPQITGITPDISIDLFAPHLSSKLGSPLREADLYKTPISAPPKDLAVTPSAAKTALIARLNSCKNATGAIKTDVTDTGLKNALLVAACAKNDGQVSKVLDGKPSAELVKLQQKLEQELAPDNGSDEAPAPDEEPAPQDQPLFM